MFLLEATSHVPRDQGFITHKGEHEIIDFQVHEARMLCQITHSNDRYVHWKWIRHSFSFFNLLPSISVAFTLFVRQRRSSKGYPLPASVNITEHRPQM